MGNGARQIDREKIAALWVAQIVVVYGPNDNSRVTYEHGPYFSKGQAKAAVKRETNPRYAGKRTGKILRAPVGDWTEVQA